METLSKKFYGLKGWQWIVLIGAGGFVLMRMRSSGSSGTVTPADTSGDATTEAGSEGFQQGYGQGYAAGNYQGQIAPTVPAPNPPAGSKNCRPMKDPTGKTHTVCGPGAFQNLARAGATPVYRWVEGATRTIYGTGQHGGIFYRPITRAHKPSPGHTITRKKPVKQQPL